MTDERAAAHDWPDEEGGEAAQVGLRSDVGSSMSGPKEEVSEPPERIEPGGQRGPAGAGDVPCPGKLGSHTPGERGNEQGPR